MLKNSFFKNISFAFRRRNSGRTLSLLIDLSSFLVKQVWLTPFLPAGLPLIVTRPVDPMWLLVAVVSSPLAGSCCRPPAGSTRPDSLLTARSLRFTGLGTWRSCQLYSWRFFFPPTEAEKSSNGLSGGDRRLSVTGSPDLGTLSLTVNNNSFI